MGDLLEEALLLRGEALPLGLKPLDLHRNVDQVSQILRRVINGGKGEGGGGVGCGVGVV